MKFRSLTGAQVAVFMPNRIEPIHVPAGAPGYETDDPSIAAWLMAALDVGEYVEPEPEVEPTETKAQAAPEPSGAGMRNKADKPAPKFQPGRAKGR